MTPVEIIYINTPLTIHEEQGEIVGNFDTTLSNIGKLQTKELSEKLTGIDISAIFTSPLTHSKETANLLFVRDLEIIEDSLLKECDFGDFNHSTLSYWKKENYITTSYENGESYLDVGYRVDKFLDFLRDEYKLKKVLVIGHESIRCALEVSINERSFREVLEESQSKELDKKRGIIYNYTLK
ncbi:MAG: histidine phosphatase family protein [Nanoarchaeota archaeon]|nr:histidine phosphatase family protein [Nanoarchaeota archaeon]